MAIDLKPTEAMAAEAERGLRWREEYGRGGTSIGVARARDISNRANLSPSTVRRMVSYFARHEVDKKGQGFSPGEEGYPSAGRIAWALWGGDSGQSWANAKARQLERETTNQSNPMQFLQIENKAGKVRLNESVNPDSMTRLIEEIDQVFGAKAAENGADFGCITNCIENAADTLEIEIHSPGGSVLDGYKLYHSILELRERGVYVTATINSLAASMASVIAMAADKIRMVKGGRMMIHEASQGVTGTAEDFARAAKLLDEISGEIADIYAGRTGAKPDEMRDLMKKETWMGADEAMDRKFIDEVVGKNDIDVNVKKLQKQTNNMSIIDKLLPNAELAAKYNAAQAELAHAESTITDLTAKLKEADSLLAEAVEETRGFSNQLIAAKVEIEVEKQAHEATKQELASVTDQLKPEALAVRISDAINSEEDADEPLKAAIEAEVTNRIVAAGHKPLDTFKAEDEEQKQIAKLSLDAFNNLSTVEKNAFFRNGGKLTK